MNRGVCILLLRVLRRGGGGGGGESEDEVTVMTSSGSGSQFLLRRGRREDSEGEGRKRGVLMRDVEVQVMRSAGRCPRAVAGSVIRRTVCVHAERV